MTVHIPIQRLQTEITNRDKKDEASNLPNVSDLEKRDEVDISQCKQMVNDWSDATGQIVYFTQERGQRLIPMMKTYFKNDMDEWHRFCGYVSESPFLMGKNDSDWKGDLDWAIKDKNLSKIMSGKFNGWVPFVYEETRHERRTSRDTEIKEVLSSIKDVQWRDWCTHLASIDQNIRPMKIRDISKAKFKEYDENVVYIECEDSKTLNYIEDLRVPSKLIDVLRCTYPEMRFFSTILSQEHSGGVK